MNASFSFSVVPAWLFILTIALVLLRPQIGRAIDRVVEFQFRRLRVTLRPLASAQIQQPPSKD